MAPRPTAPPVKVLAGVAIAVALGAAAGCGAGTGVVGSVDGGPGSSGEGGGPPGDGGPARTDASADASRDAAPLSTGDYACGAQRCSGTQRCTREIGGACSLNDAGQCVGSEQWFCTDLPGGCQACDCLPETHGNNACDCRLESGHLFVTCANP